MTDRVLKLAKIMKGIPKLELSALIEEADRFLIDCEFGQPNLSRNARPEDPYWYERELIKSADEYLASGKPLSAAMYCLEEHNHGHSGFVDQVWRVYCRPRNEVEEGVSEEIRQMITRIVTALLESEPTKLEKGALGDGWFSVCSINSGLWLLGAQAPQELVDRFKRLVVDYERADPENNEFASLKFSAMRRFGQLPG